jgi:ubiquinone/menaquinone biosynthesis C-methylase UbiE
MVNFLKKFFSQTAHPEGFLGRIMLRMMNFGHAPLTNWGLDQINFKDQWTILDIGCGGGATLQRLLKRSKNSKVYGIDISDESIKKAKEVNEKELGKSVFIEKGSATELPYADRCFDLVTAVETVYFWPELPKCLKEVRRVLKPGGQFAIMVEVIETDSMWTNIVKGMTAYSPEQLKDMLDTAGFADTQVFRTKPSYATILGVNP